MQRLGKCRRTIAWLGWACGISNEMIKTSLGKNMSDSLQSRDVWAEKHL